MSEEPEFTDEERRRVRRVLAMTQDEFDDCGSVDGMFAPFAAIVQLILTPGPLYEAITTELLETDFIAEIGDPE